MRRRNLLPINYFQRKEEKGVSLFPFWALESLLAAGRGGENEAYRERRLHKLGRTLSIHSGAIATSRKDPWNGGGKGQDWHLNEKNWTGGEKWI